MSWKPLLVAALLALPTILVVSPAAMAQDNVPIAPSIRWEPLVGFEQKLYMNHPDVGSQLPDGAPVGGVGDSTTRQPDCNQPRLRYEPRTESTENPRNPCVYQATIPGQQNDVVIEYRTAPLVRSFNVSGNNALTYVHHGRLPTGLTLTAEVRTGDTPIARGAFTATAQRNGQGIYTIELPILASIPRDAFLKDRALTIALRGTVSGAGDAVAVPTSQPTWTLEDTGSYLSIRAEDAMRAATWVADEDGRARDLFKPLDINATGRSRLVGFFALDSAFGRDNAAGNPNQLRPVFTLTRHNETVHIPPNNANSIVGEWNNSASQGGPGLAVWSFPGGMLDYRGFKSGEYRLDVAKPYFQGGAISRGVSKSFLLSSQTVSLGLYQERNLGAIPFEPETTAHEVIAGNSTTYVLVINNTGAVNDTFRVDVALQNANPAAGWSALVGGPDVRQRSVHLAPNESKLVTVTITAPAGAPIGSSAVFTAVARSSVDPEAKSDPLPLIPTVAASLTRSVGTLVTHREFLLEPGVSQEFPVYVWNRGTRVTDIAIEIDRVPLAGWEADLLLNGLPVSRVVVPNVLPGGIAEVTLRAQGPLNSREGEHPILLKVADNNADTIVGERPIMLKLNPTSGVKLDVLEAIGGTKHIAELTGNFTDPVVGASLGDDPRCDSDMDAGVGCYKDGIDGIWFRVWVTNTGKVQDNFTLSAESPSVPGDCSDPYAVSEVPTVHYRAPDGSVRGLPALDLAPGETREAYIWKSIRRETNPCDSVTDNVYSFVVVARGRTTGAIATFSADVRAEDSSTQGTAAVLLEFAKRDIGTLTQPASGPYKVDASLARERQATGYAEVNGTVSYFVRVTNAASWSTYTNERGDSVSPTVRVAIENVNKEKGWNVSVRPRNGIEDVILNPWKDHYNLTNDMFNGRREGWADMELEVRVEAPKAGNASAAGANEQDSFNLRASLDNSRAVSSLEITTIISPMANVTVSTDTPQLRVHAGRAGAYLLYVNNTGAVGTKVTVRADMLEGTTGDWTIEPASQTFTLGAFKNRTLALSVTPPGTAGVGTVAGVNLSVEFAPNPNLPTVTKNVTSVQPLTAEVYPRGTLELVATRSSETVSPGGSAILTLTLRNTGQGGVGNVPFTLSRTPIPDWQTTLSASSQAPIEPGQDRSIVYQVTAPVSGVTADTSYSSIVRVEELGNPANFDQVPVIINIEGGSPTPSLTVDKTQKTVARDGTQAFQVNVRNLGTAVGTFVLETRVAEQGWNVNIQDSTGGTVRRLTLGPNEVAPLNVTVRAPFTVPERTIIPIDVLASTENLTQSARITLRAQVQDYGVNLEMATTRFDIIAGEPTEFILKLRNDGNDNDTLNVSAQLLDLPDWNVQLSTERVRLEPKQEVEIRATVRSPTDPLPPARSYSFKFFAGTIGGAAVNLSKNDSIPATVTVLNYRALDVDGDGRQELAVDKDKDASNGFEHFREVFPDGLRSVVVASSILNGKTRFFLDVPTDGYDGLADAWYDPEAVYVYRIVYNRADLNEDGTPEYLLDTDRDRKIDSAYETESSQYWSVTEIKMYGNDTLQFLVDINGDGRPDRFYDPATNVVTRTKSVSGEPNVVGLDTNKDDKVDKYYDMKAKTITDAALGNFAGFARDYFYFLLAFVAMVVLTVVLLVARRRRS